MRYQRNFHQRLAGRFRSIDNNSIAPPPRVIRQRVATGFVLGLVTFVIAVLPFLLLIGLPTVLGFRYFWRKQARPKSVSEIARDEIT